MILTLLYTVLFTFSFRGGATGDTGTEGYSSDGAPRHEWGKKRGTIAGPGEKGLSFCGGLRLGVGRSAPRSRVVLRP